MSKSNSTLVIDNRLIFNGCVHDCGTCRICEEEEGRIVRLQREVNVLRRELEDERWATAGWVWSEEFQTAAAAFFAPETCYPGNDGDDPRLVDYDDVPF